MQNGVTAEGNLVRAAGLGRAGPRLHSKLQPGHASKPLLLLLPCLLTEHQAQQVSSCCKHGQLDTISGPRPPGPIPHFLQISHPLPDSWPHLTSIRNSSSLVAPPAPRPTDSVPRGPATAPAASPESAPAADTVSPASVAGAVVAPDPAPGGVGAAGGCNKAACSLLLLLLLLLLLMPAANSADAPGAAAGAGAVSSAGLSLPRCEGAAAPERPVAVGASFAAEAAAVGAPRMAWSEAPFPVNCC
jgi:hypothetical protein